MTPMEAEHDIRNRARIVEIALGAYNAVWRSWPRIDAENVEECRRVAMSAAIGAISNGDRA